MVNGLFVTGTDTGIGKTILTASLVAAARRNGRPAAPMKPVQTGCTPGPRGLQATDLDLGLAWSGLAVSDEEYDRLAPVRLPDACSPHLAARRAGRPIDLPPLVAAARAAARIYDPLIVEGAGGVLVPINEHESMLDLMRGIGFPVLVAARPGLGTINHTLLTLDRLAGAGLAATGVVFVESEPAARDYIEMDNRETLTSWGRVPILGVLPYCPHGPDQLPAPESLLTAAERILETLEGIRIGRPGTD